MGLNFCMNCMKQLTAPGPCPYCGFREDSYVASPRHLPLGTILNGKYLVGRTLGEGGFGITYVGCDLALGLKLAIKEYYPNELVTRENSRSNQVVMMTGKRDEVFRDEKGKFLEEARCLAKFWGLPGIVAVKDFFQENGTAYIAMEFVEGQTLEQLLVQRGGSLEPEQVLRLIDPVMISLEKVHESGLIHRDISPDNIMVTSDGQCKLIDFGAARDFTAGGRELSVILRPKYAPLEQYGGRGKQGPWTDVYALCATMYRAITGQKPDDVMSRVEADPLIRPSEMGISMPDYQESALMKGLALYAQNRFQSVGELREALRPPQNQQRENPPEPGGGGQPDALSWAETQPEERSTRQQEGTGNLSAAGQTENKPSRGMWLGIGAAALLLMAAIVVGVSLITFSLLSASNGKQGKNVVSSTSASAQPEEENDGEGKEETQEAKEESRETVETTAEALVTTEAPTAAAPTVPAITMGDVLSVTATSSLSEYNMTHTPNRLMDGDLATGWVEGVSGQGQGQSVTFVFRGDYRVSGFSIYAGYHKNWDLYQKNSRPSALRVSFPSGVSETYLLEDVFARQDIALTEPVVAGQVTFTIESVYPGGKYEDTVISELSLY